MRSEKRQTLRETGREYSSRPFADICREKEDHMRIPIRRIIYLLLALAFLVSTGTILAVRLRYRTSREKYGDAAEQYTELSEDASETASPGMAPAAEPDAAASAATGAFGADADSAPIQVDFEQLRKVNGDVIGWIFCPDTAINYPVVHATDNEYYLDRDYRREYDPNGAIFTDEDNSPGFADSNTIIYGHHMADMSMFASLEYWLDQEYFDAHPVMWLLTPEQDYRIDLFSCYSTTEDSASYTIYYGPGTQFDYYLKRAAADSAFHCSVELEPDAHYVLLSTCAYGYDEGRTVLHGKLVPINSSGTQTSQ